MQTKQEMRISLILRDYSVFSPFFWPALMTFCIGFHNFLSRNAFFLFSHNFLESRKTLILQGFYWLCLFLCWILMTFPTAYHKFFAVRAVPLTLKIFQKFQETLILSHFSFLMLFLAYVFMTFLTAYHLISEYPRFAENCHNLKEPWFYHVPGSSCLSSASF